MKGYRTEFIALALQAAAFFLLPLLFGALTPIGTVLLLVVLTALVALTVGMASDKRLRFLFPLAVALLFLPSVPVYYNPSAFVHAAWYFAVALFALMVGALARRLICGKEKGEE